MRSSLLVLGGARSGKSRHAQAAAGQAGLTLDVQRLALLGGLGLVVLGITASLQPPHPPGAMDFPLQPTLDKIGKDRWADAYLWRTLVEAGAPVAFASDWPVTDVSVLRGLQAALTRQPYAGATDERLSLMDSLYAYTAGGAWAAQMDDITGRLVPGLAADLVLIDGDLEAVAAEEIGAMSVALTICGGRITHRAGI